MLMDKDREPARWLMSFRARPDGRGAWTLEVRKDLYPSGTRLLGRLVLVGTIEGELMASLIEQEST